ncbi:msb1l [Anticarsia gemmatalis]|uniref:msb1l n=1 Tax=Anticarsia gemmatalis TaxID=129554 RepID=UPI003F75F25B
MGSNTSKTTNEAAVVSIRNDLDICENPDPTDPRSPTPEITRTPLQNKTSGKHNITKNVDLRKTFENANGEEKLIHNNPILSAVIKNHLQSYDPRSPTQDFERTPIIISTKTDDMVNGKQMLRLHHDNCASPVLKADKDDECDSCTEACERSPDLVVSRNLCEGLFNVTLDDTLKEPEEPLCSSTASKEAIENNMSREAEDKPTTLLETNFDYIENDNDKFEDSEDNVNDTGDDEVNDVPVYEILDEDPRSPSIGIERTPIVVAKIDEGSNVENMSDDSLIKVLQSTNAELRHNIKPEKNGDGLLIYEDESSNINDTPKKSKSGSMSGSRTPLSCMKNKADAGHTRSKSANTLFDPKNQQNGLSKIPKRVSHIPRLKCLSKQTKLMPTGSSVSLKNISKTTADCENTPPHSHRDRWDKDSSIVL